MKHLRVAAFVAMFACGSAAHATTNLVQNGDFTTLSKGSGFFGPSNIAPGGLVTNTTAADWTSTGYNYALTSAEALPATRNGFQLWDATNITSGSNTWSGLAPSGNFIAMDGDYNTGKVYQDVSGLTVGDNYSLTFSYAFSQQQDFNGATAQGLKVGLGTSLGGGSDPIVWQSLSNPVADEGFSGWQSATVNFTASAATEELSFLAASTPAVPPFTLVTDVSIEAAPGPTPGAGLTSLAFVALLLAGAKARGFALRG